MKKMKFKAVDTVWEVPVCMIIPAEYNPPSRSLRESLRESIKHNGQHVPIHVCWSLDRSKLEMIEGHGRLSCHIDLNLPTIKAIVSDYIPPQERAYKYEQINSESKPHKGADKVYEYLKNRWSVSNTERSQFGRVIRETGDGDTLKNMVKHDKGWHFYINRCLPIANWVGVADEPHTFKKFVLWLLEHEKAVTESRYLLERKRESHIDEGKAVAEILSAFRANRVPNRAKADKYTCTKVA